jgi:hypothetical protein
MNTDNFNFPSHRIFHLRVSVMCMDAQIPRAQDAQERPFICG